VLRLIAILALVVAGLPPLVAAPRPLLPASASCCDAACTHVVLQTTCCGEVIQETPMCPQSGGACGCGVRPAPESRPVPELPPVNPGRSVVSSLSPAPAVLSTVPELDAPLRVEAAVSSFPRSQRSHNGVQALLGVWRT
jgi:hypothetical protein